MVGVLVVIIRSMLRSVDVLWFAVYSVNGYSQNTDSYPKYVLFLKINYRVFLPGLAVWLWQAFPITHGLKWAQDGGGGGGGEGLSGLVFCCGGFVCVIVASASKGMVSLKKIEILKAKCMSKMVLLMPN